MVKVWTFSEYSETHNVATWTIGCCSGPKPIIAVPGPTVVYKVTPNIKKESPGADTQCQCLTEILYDVHHNNLILHELFIYLLENQP